MHSDKYAEDRDKKKRNKNGVNKLRLLKTKPSFDLLQRFKALQCLFFIFRFLTAESDRFGLIDLQ